MSFFGTLFGDFFDFNADGRVDEGEQWLGYKIFEDATAEDDTDDSDIDIVSDDFDFSDLDEW